MWENAGNCNEVMSLLQMLSDHFWEKRRIVISEVCHHLNKTQKEFCLKERIFTNALKRSRTSFARWTYSSEKITEKVGKKLKWLSMKPINNLNHRHWSYIKQTSGLTELKKKKIWRFQNEKQNQPRTSRKRLPRNGWIKKNFLWASGWSQTFQNWWTLHAEERESLHRESTFVPNSGLVAQHELFEWRKRFSWSWDSKQLWNVAHSQSTQENSGSQKNDQLRFGFAAQYSEWCG